MSKYFTFLLLTFTIYVNGQIKKPFSITIGDNHNFQYLQNEYCVTADSLVITAINDKGDTHIDYLKRKLTRPERKSLFSYLGTYKSDSLKSDYFGEFTNLKYIAYDHYPRIINITFKSGNMGKKVKVTNCYVYIVADLIHFLNAIIPPEVQIKYEKSDYEKKY